MGNKFIISLEREDYPWNTCVLGDTIVSSWIHMKGEWFFGVKWGDFLGGNNQVTWKFKIKINLGDVVA